MKTINPKKVSMALALAVSSLFATAVHATDYASCRFYQNPGPQKPGHTCASIDVPAGKRVRVDVQLYNRKGDFSVRIKMINDTNGFTVLNTKTSNSIDYYYLPALPYASKIHGFIDLLGKGSGGAFLDYQVIN